MKHIYNLKPDKEDPLDYSCSFKTMEIPDKLSFRKDCPPIYDQLELGSCTSNAWLFVYRMWCKSHGIDANIDYARMKHYYDERVLEGTVNEDAGAQMRTGGKVLQKIGVCHEELWPYIINKFAVEPNSKAVKDSKNHKIPAYRRLKNLTEVKQYLTKMQEIGTPAGVVVGIKLFESFESAKVKRTGIIPMPKELEEFLGCHAVAIIGFDDTKKTPSCGILESILCKLMGIENDGGYGELPNSWGVKWGDHGFFWLPYDYIIKYGFDFWVISEIDEAG